MNNTNPVTKALFTAAFNLNLLSAQDLIEVSAGGVDSESLIQKVDAIAEAHRHDNPQLRRAWFEAHSAVYWFTSPVAHETPDKFGFQAATRQKCREALLSVGIDESLVAELQRDGLQWAKHVPALVV